MFIYIYVLRMVWRAQPIVSLKISTHFFKYWATATKSNFNIYYAKCGDPLYCCLVNIENYEWFNEHIFLIMSTQENQQRRKMVFESFSKRKIFSTRQCFTYNCVCWPQAPLLISYTKIELNWIEFDSLVWHLSLCVKHKLCDHRTSK